MLQATWDYLLLLNHCDIFQEFPGAMPDVKQSRLEIPASPEKWVWHNFTAKYWWVKLFFTRNVEVSIFLTPNRLCWKAGSHGTRCALIPPFPTAFFNNKRRGVHEDHSHVDLCLFDCQWKRKKQEGKDRKRIVWLFHFILKCFAIVVLYLVFGGFPSLGTFLQSACLFWNLEGNRDL